MLYARKSFHLASPLLSILAFAVFTAGLVQGASTVTDGTITHQGELIKVGGSLPTGKALTTGSGKAEIDLDGLAAVTVSPDSEVVLDGLKDGGKTSSFTLNAGTVEVKTGDVPENGSVSVDTPIGTCVTPDGAFTVTYELLPDGITRKMTITCTAGEVKIDGKYISTPNDTLRAGGSLSFTVVDCPQRKCIYFPDITVKGQDLNLAMGGKNSLTLSDNTALEGAMDYGTPESPFSGISVKEGAITAGGLEITAGMPPLFIQGDRVIMGNENQKATEPFTIPKKPTDLITVHDKKRLVIADTEFTEDVVLYSDKIVGGDWLRDNVEFTTNEFRNMPNEGVKDLIVGAGPEELITIPESVLTFLDSQGISVNVMPTDQAVRTYNQAVKDGKGETTAAIILLEDYMNAEDYLDLARKAAANQIAGEKGPIAPLPPPPFVTPTPETAQPLPPIPDTPQSP